MSARYNKRHKRLRKGESQKANGDYTYRWTDRSGKRHSFGAKSLEELRSKEEELARDKADGIKQCIQNVILNDIYDLWRTTKRGLKDNTFQNYCWCNEQYVKDDIGMIPIQQLKRSDIKRFYNKLYEERRLKVATIDNVHTVLHQVIQVR